MQRDHESWAGPITAVGSWLTVSAWPVLHPYADWLLAYGLPITMGVSTIWWTVAKALREMEQAEREREQARRERAVRRAYDAALDPDHRSIWARLLRRPPITGPVPLDCIEDSGQTTDPQAHHLGKDSRA